MMAIGRIAAAQIAESWIDVALHNYLVAETLRLRLIYECFLFLLMGFDSNELRVWRQNDHIEVVPAMMADN